MAERRRCKGLAAFGARQAADSGAANGILLRCNREAMTCEGNDSILRVLFRHHTRSADTV
jgi:hypothetical protein